MRKLNSFITIISIVTVLVFLTAAESKETYEHNTDKASKVINISQKKAERAFEKISFFRN